MIKSIKPIEAGLTSLQWEPSKRSSAKELADDEWIMGYL